MDKDVCQTSRALSSTIPSWYPSKDLNQNQRTHDSNEMETQVQQFREKVIAPLQTMQAGFPKLQLRLDHRRGALETFHKYRRKVDDLSSTYKPESARMQRVSFIITRKDR